MATVIFGYWFRLRGGGSLFIPCIGRMIGTGVMIGGFGGGGLGGLGSPVGAAPVIVRIGRRIDVCIFDALCGLIWDTVR